MSAIDELIEKYNRILIASYGKPRPMTEEEYRDLEKGVYTASGEGDWSVTPETATPEEELTPIVNEERTGEKQESLPGWPKKVEFPSGQSRSFESPEEWEKYISEKTESEEDKQNNDEEIIRMINEDPLHVVTNLMLHRKPEYKRFTYKILRALVDWVTESKVPFEKGSIVVEEAKYMLNELEQKR